MISHWFSRVNSVIPRGFSRQYILNLLKEKPMSGKEIVDFAIYESEGKWKPSPGLIYPMLGRLLEEGLISETENGIYKMTEQEREKYKEFLITELKKIEEQEKELK